MACAMRSTRVILSFSLALLSGNAAAEWAAVGGDNTIYSAFADKATIRRNGTLVRMSGLYDFRRQDFTPEGKGLYSTVVLREYDCEGRRVRLLSSIDFSGRMGAGEPVDSSTRTGRWESIVAGAIDELYWNAACGAK